MAKLEPRDHTISLAVAATYTRRHRNAAPGPIKDGDHAHAFQADQVLKLVQQKGCDAVRIYYGQDDKGHRAPILVGVDETGKDMTSGVLLQMGWPCPPYCDDTSTLKG